MYTHTEGADNPLHPRRLHAGERRQAILEAAIRLFSRNGFRGTTTREIAHEAGVNEALIFRHFANKQDLYAAILDYKTGQPCCTNWLADIRGRAGGDEESFFLYFGSRILEQYREDPDFLRLMVYSSLEGHELTQMFRERYVRVVRDFLREYVEERQRAGLFRPGDPDAMVRAFLGMVVHYAMGRHLFHDETLPAHEEETLRTFIRTLLDGIRQPNQVPRTKA